MNTHQATHTPGQDNFADLVKLSQEARDRMASWVDEMPETPAKEIARDVAQKWINEGVTAATGLFRMLTIGMVRWEQSAVVDMCAALRVKAMVARATGGAV